MMTLRQLAAEPPTIPTRTGWYLADLGEAKGKYELYTRQSPQKLKVLREHALIESAVSSNRIEGVEVDKARIGTLMFGKPALRDRDEEEVRGYRDALNLIHESGARLPLSEATIKRLHRLSRGQIWDAGCYKEKDVGDFGLTHLERLCPGVSRDMIRLLLRDLKAAGRVECIGRGPGAKWRKRVLPLKEGKKGGNNQNA